MVRKYVLSLIPALVASARVAPYEPRAVETNQVVYAFGTDIPDLQIYADSDGLAVIAVNKSAGLSEVAWTIDPTGNSAWNVSLKAATDNSSFYIVPNGDGYVQAGFTVDGLAPTGAETLGFVLYGSDIMFNTGKTYLYQFWAQTTSAGIWNLVWNTDGDLEEGIVPVMLKVMAQ